MVKTNKFSVSYGLIVKTKDKKVVILQRKIPYSVQNVLMRRDTHLNLNNYKETFIKDHFKTLNFSMKLDYLNFIHNSSFEDQYDFPHGQMCLNSFGKQMKKTIKLTKDQGNFYAFMTAVREFKEETGYIFHCEKSIKNIPLQKVTFIGLDGYTYTQIFFIITVDKLEKCKDIEMDRFFEPLIIDISKAIYLFEKQQKIKRDGKDLILKTLL